MRLGRCEDVADAVDLYVDAWPWLVLMVFSGVRVSQVLEFSIGARPRYCSLLLVGLFDASCYFRPVGFLGGVACYDYD
jgi:hypothetical protein